MFLVDAKIGVKQPITFVLKFLNGIVMTLTMVRQLQCSDVSVILFMECLYRFGAVDEYLDRSVVYLRNGLYFDIIAPLSVFALSHHITIEIFSNVIFKESFFTLNVVHTKVSNFLMIGLVS